MARKLQLLPDFFVNMDNIVSWQLVDDAIIIDTVATTIRVGLGYADDVQVTSSDLIRIINDIDGYFL
ncbi:hypothetical protein LZS85_12615 [Aliivibrio fischeri]|uniref:hypothetical protein n=1 Tax=Aliivibrio fischeri TaxID=668 RepID=UPI001F1B4ADC|nr:hypothetical protein [Aliivibrio fischeri]MCE7566960.1 hypothetical protein [Aliivibrio fischeri]